MAIGIIIGAILAVCFFLGGIKVNQRYDKHQEIKAQETIAKQQEVANQVRPAMIIKMSDPIAQFEEKNEQ